MRSNCDTTSESIEMLDDRKKITNNEDDLLESERSSESDRVSKIERESAIARVSEREKKRERDFVC